MSPFDSTQIYCWFIVHSELNVLGFGCCSFVFLLLFIVNPQQLHSQSETSLLVGKDRHSDIVDLMGGNACIATAKPTQIPGFVMNMTSRWDLWHMFRTVGYLLYRTFLLDLMCWKKVRKEIKLLKQTIRKTNKC